MKTALRSLNQAMREEVHAVGHYAKLRKLTGSKLFSHIGRQETHHLQELKKFKKRLMR
jgi:rubrerythrin